MAINYVTAFETQLQQQYARELTSSALTTDNARFIGAQTVKIPKLALSGYKDHSRAGGWNAGTYSNDFDTKQLAHDRDVSFYVDAEDVDETNQILSAANITSVFNNTQAIPELDCYRYSKLYADFKTFGGTPDTTVLDNKVAIQVFDQLMENMDEAGVPTEGRQLYVTSHVNTLLKQAADFQRFVQVDSNTGNVNRVVHSLDDVDITVVPSTRMKTVYDFTQGFATGVGAQQINMIIIHPTAVIAPIKRSSIYLWAPGTHTQGDGWLYQNRSFVDLFVIGAKVPGIQMNVTPINTPTTGK
jgi:hypothetical protein